MVCKCAVSGGTRWLLLPPRQAIFPMQLVGVAGKDAVSVLAPRYKNYNYKRTAANFETFFLFFFLRNIIGPYFLSNGHSSLNRHIYKIDVKNKFINFLTKIV